MAEREFGRTGRDGLILPSQIVDRGRRLLENGATRQQVADVIGVGIKTVYKYFAAR
ncbi:TPA: helix-turn-helix domain-containing protein [Klebsiella pneumoniae]|nr:helix-turn-helix domain-containing protein [Klebsiella pneumoniae]